MMEKMGFIFIKVRNMNKKKIITLLLALSLLTSMSGCAWISNKIKEVKGELIGNRFNISVYDNFGTNILNVSGDKIQVDNNTVEVLTVNADGSYSTTYEMSSVLSNTIDGNNMETVGNTVIYAEEGIHKIKDFEMNTNINTSGGTINLIDRNINKIKNLIGTSKVVIVSSQMGVPLAVYGGEKVYYEIPDDLPKMTKLNIDGKALYIHRANYIILDTEMIE